MSFAKNLIFILISSTSIYSFANDPCHGLANITLQSAMASTEQADAGQFWSHYEAIISAGFGPKLVGQSKITPLLPFNVTEGSKTEMLYYQLYGAGTGGEFSLDLFADIVKVTSPDGEVTCKVKSVHFF